MTTTWGHHCPVVSRFLQLKGSHKLQLLNHPLYLPIWFITVHGKENFWASGFAEINTGYFRSGRPWSAPVRSLFENGWAVNFQMKNWETIKFISRCHNSQLFSWSSTCTGKDGSGFHVPYRYSICPESSSGVDTELNLVCGDAITSCMIIITSFIYVSKNWRGEVSIQNTPLNTT